MHVQWHLFTVSASDRQRLIVAATGRPQKHVWRRSGRADYRGGIGGTAVVPPDASILRDEFDNLFVDLQRGIA